MNPTPFIIKEQDRNKNQLTVFIEPLNVNLHAFEGREGELHLQLVEGNIPVRTLTLPIDGTLDRVESVPPTYLYVFYDSGDQIQINLSEDPKFLIGKLNFLVLAKDESIKDQRSFPLSELELSKNNRDCTWRRASVLTESTLLKSGCGALHEDTPVAPISNFNHCPYCGKKLVHINGGLPREERRV